MKPKKRKIDTSTKNKVQEIKGTVSFIDGGKKISLQKQKKKDYFKRRYDKKAQSIYKLEKKTRREQTKNSVDDLSKDFKKDFKHSKDQSINKPEKKAHREAHREQTKISVNSKDSKDSKKDFKHSKDSKDKLEKKAHRETHREQTKISIDDHSKDKLEKKARREETDHFQDDSFSDFSDYSDNSETLPPEEEITSRKSFQSLVETILNEPADDSTTADPILQHYAGAQRKLREQRQKHRKQKEKRKLGEMVKNKEYHSPLDREEPRIAIFERKLRKIATQGVVRLFNAVSTNKRKQEENKDEMGEEPQSSRGSLSQQILQRQNKKK